jgi:hypothetical protein
MQVAVTPDLGLLNQKLAQELAQVEAAAGPTVNRDRQDILGLQQNLPQLLKVVANYPNFALFDFQSKKEIHQVDLGEGFSIKSDGGSNGTIMEDELEFELFDAVRVSNEVPFVVLNVDRHKIKGVKGLYLSRDRRFKLYHSKDIEVFHEPLVQDWATQNKLNQPFTMIIKVLMTDETAEIPVKKSYIDVVYRFGEGLFIEFKSDREEKNVNHVIDVLRRHLTGFQPTLAGLTSISGSFIVDRLVVEPALFRGILNQPHNLFPNAYPLLLSPVLWVNEKGQSLAFRKQFILNFKLGDVKAKVIISEKIAENKNVHYLKGVPVTLVADTHYDHITISEVQSKEHALLVRDILAVAFFMYGVPKPNDDGSVRSRSMDWANILNHFIGGMSFVGSVFGESKLVSTENIKAMRKNIARLKAVDPTFYGSIATAKAFGSIRQPGFVVSTSDPNWQEILWTSVQQVYQNDEPNKRRQIIRYPLDVVDTNNESLSQPPVTKVPPYFLICSPESPFFSMKLNKDPVGSRGTLHPYLPSCMTTQSITTPGNDNPQDKFGFLANLHVPFNVQSMDKPTSERGASSNYEAKSQKILKPEATGLLPNQVERILMSGFSVTARGEAVTDLQFRKHGTELSMNSLLHVLVRRSVHRPDLQRVYATKFNDAREDYLTELKLDIANRVNWNLARQEFFDMEADQIKANFLRDDSPIDSRLYKAILEQYFNVYLMIIRYEDFQSYIEIPRHKFLYIPPSYPPNVQPLVIFKHGGSDRNSQYEYVEMLARENANSSLVATPWNFHILKSLFDRVNRTAEISFTTLRLREEGQYQTGPVIRSQVDIKPSLSDVFELPMIQRQFIDGAGKLRAFVLRYPNRDSTKDIVISVEPLPPLGIATFDDAEVASQDFDETLAFIQMLGIRLEDVAYRMESEEVEVIEEVEQESDDQTRRRIEAEKEAKRERARAREIERSISARERILGAEVLPGRLLGDGTTDSSVSSAVETTGLSFLQELKAAEERRKQEAARALAPAIIVAPPDNTPKKTVTVRVVKKSEGPTLAIGVWFTLRGLQFYIATTPGQPATANYSINNIPYFEVNTSNHFRDHDYYERVANIMVQLLRNLYVYSRLEDPEYFIDAMTVINPDVVYDLASAKRRIPATRNFRDDLFGYVRQFPTFFTILTAEEIAAGQSPRMTVDSYATKKSLLAHLKIMQQLKEDIIGATGSNMTVQRGSNSPDGIRRILYEPFIDGRYEPLIIGVTDRMIDKLARLKEFYYRPAFIVEFYSYASDFTVRGPDQNVFMTEDEIVQYIDLSSMETQPQVISAPLDKSVAAVRLPMYFVARDGSLYIFQNVQGGNQLAALNVLQTWESQRINLGFFAPPAINTTSAAVIVNIDDLPKMDINQHYFLVEYKQRAYAAMFKMSSPVVYGQVE